MTSQEVISLIISLIGVSSFTTLITIFYRSYINTSVKEIKDGNFDIEIIDEEIHNSLPKVLKKKKIVKAIRRILFWLVVVLMLPFLVFAIISRINNGTVMINDTAVLAIESGSMSYKNENNTYLDEKNLDNQFPTFSLIFVEKVENPKEEIDTYDVIVFKTKDGINIVHRVVGQRDYGNLVQYTTRGDALDKDDGFYPTSNDVVGRYTGKYIPVVGMLVIFFQSPSGMVTLASLIYCFFMLDYYNTKNNNEKNKRFSLLNESIKLRESLDCDEIKQVFYKDVKYIFNNTGFIKKEEINDDLIKGEAEHKIIVEIITKKKESD